MGMVMEVIGNPYKGGGHSFHRGPFLQEEFNEQEECCCPLVFLVPTEDYQKE